MLDRNQHRSPYLPTARVPGTVLFRRFVNILELITGVYFAENQLQTGIKNRRSSGTHTTQNIGHKQRSQTFHDRKL